MINAINFGSMVTPMATETPNISGFSDAQPANATFSETLKKSIDEVSRLQEDASQAVTDLATGKTENVTGVMTAMEKADLAFKTLLAIRSKLMDAFDEVKGMSI